MPNEKKTENIVRKLLSDNGYTNNDNIIIEEQSSDNAKIDKLLKSASKSGNGKGYPEFIISFKDSPDNLVVVECKADLSKHESKTRKNYKDYAVDGVLLYANYLKDQFNVIAIAVSGETEQEIKISHFIWLKGKHTHKDISDKKIVNSQSLFNIIDKQSQPLKEEELIKKAIEYNEKLHKNSMPEVERCTLISSILVALQDNGFTESYKSYHKTDEGEDYSPNEALIEHLLSACENVLKRNSISIDKRITILGEYSKIKQNHILKSKRIRTGKDKKEEINTVLRDLIEDLNQQVMPYINANVFDILGKFYTQFIRYAGSDSKTGLVLTPSHITDLFCELADMHENDKVFDPCCGTGGFLVSAMKYMMAKSNNVEKHKKIKLKQLIGIERRADMFSHACSNMMMQGDGKSHIYFGDCFNTKLKQSIKTENPTKSFLNPPYDVGEDGQLEFVENAIDCIVPGGICIAICQMSTVISAKKTTIEIKQRLLKKHTLEAVLSMPDDLFYPIGVVTCIIILKAHAPHPKTKETFFGYFKNDGFLKVKHKGRIEQPQKWDSIKKKWLHAYINRKNIPGLSITQVVNSEDEWCAEAYMETDYSALSESRFIKEIKRFAAFKLTSDDGGKIA